MRLGNGSRMARLSCAFLLLVVTFLVAPVAHAQLNISVVAKCSAAATTCTPSGGTILANDVAIAFAFRDASTTAPTLATGFTNLTTNSSATVGTSTTSSSRRTACKTMTGTDVWTNAWTNATDLSIIVLRGLEISGGQEACTLAIGASAVASSTGTTSFSYPALTMLRNTENTSMVLGWIGIAASSTNGLNAPTGMIQETTVGTGPAVAVQITGSGATPGTVSSWSAQTVTGGTSVRYLSMTVQVLAQRAISVVQTATGTGATLTTATSTSITTHTGNTITVFCATDSPSDTVAVSDGTNTFTPVGSGVVSDGTAGNARMFVAKNITGVTHAFVCTFSPNTGNTVVFAHEFFGASTTNPVDVPAVTDVAGAHGTSATPSFTLPATSANNEALVFGASCGNTCSAGAGTESTIVNTGDVSEVYFKATPGTYTGSFSQTSGSFDALGVAIQPPSTGTPAGGFNKKKKLSLYDLL